MKGHAKPLLALLSLILALCLAACGDTTQDTSGADVSPSATEQPAPATDPPVDTGDVIGEGDAAEEDDEGHAAADEAIDVIGLPDGKSAQITGAQLMELTPFEVEAELVTSSGDRSDVKVVGTTLDTLLGTLGVSQKSYSSIVVSASDGYSVELPAEVLQQRDVVIAWEVDGEQESPRIIIPGERAMYWVKFLAKIELFEAYEDIKTDTVNVLETMIAGLEDQVEDYDYQGSADKAVRISALLGKYVEPQPLFVPLMSADGLAKNEKYDIVVEQYIKFTGEFAPLFIGPQLPEGMTLKETAWMKLEHIMILSAETAAKMLGGSLSGGFSLSEAFELIGMTESETYNFIGGDGYEVQIASGDIEKGEIKLEDGKVVVQFEGLARNTTVKGLLEITAG